MVWYETFDTEPFLQLFMSGSVQNPYFSCPRKFQYQISFLRNQKKDFTVYQGEEPFLVR
jgi:hypothetical protein